MEHPQHDGRKPRPAHEEQDAAYQHRRQVEEQEPGVNGKIAEQEHADGDKHRSQNAIRLKKPAGHHEPLTHKPGDQPQKSQ